MSSQRANRPLVLNINAEDCIRSQELNIIVESAVI